MVGSYKYVALPLPKHTGPGGDHGYTIFIGQGVMILVGSYTYMVASNTPN